MNVNDIYPSKYLKAADLGNARITVQVGGLSMESVGENEPDKPVLHFHGKDKGMVLNKTNLTLCAAVWGPETTTWAGMWLEVFTEPKMYKGEMVQGLSVSPKLPNSASAAAEDNNQKPQHDNQPIDDVPF